MRAPCKGCGERTATCHADCERYGKYRAWRDEMNRRQYAEKVAGAMNPGAARKMEKNLIYIMKKR